MSNFTATQVRQQAEELDNQVEKFVRYATAFNTELQGIQGRFGSQDSVDVKNQMTKLLNNLSNVRNDIQKDYKALSETMKDYANRTSQNEQTLEEELKSMNSTLQGILDRLNAITVRYNG